MQSSNLDTLTKKIYNEGIEKAEEEASQIINKAQEEADGIIAEASKKAENILTNARKDAEQLARKSEGEIKLKSLQLVSDLKKQIKELIKDRIIKDKIKESTMDTDFLKAVIVEMVSDWKKTESAELVFSEDLKSKLDESLDKAIAGTLSDMTISYSDKLSTGFRISRGSDNFQITFTDEDFTELFSEYLDSRTSELLFN
jgi:V/A-type H+-transporting ATPase subunit E